MSSQAATSPLSSAGGSEGQARLILGVPPRRFFAFIGMILGMFMAILDIQVVSASLAEIQAGLSASADEISWVQTAYLIAEVVMIPLSGFLARLLSTRVLFTVCAAGFTLASILCATATSIEQMIIYRALQGFIGGGMIPSVFAAAFTVFPPSRRSTVSPLIGLIATLAPTIGPTVGGYLSNAFSWHWLFLINVVPGIIVSISAWNLIDFDEADWSLFDRFDWTGLAAMAVFLGSLEYVLEEGPRYSWFQDPTIATVGIAMVVGCLVFFWRAFMAPQPIVDIRAFADRNFAFGSAFSFVMGIGLYGLTYLYPIYLARIRGYDALMIGETMFVSGLAMFMTAPIAGRMSQILDLRVMMVIGFAGFGLGTWIVTGITSEWDFWQLLVPQILRGCSLMLCMVPINNLALGTLAPDQVKNASGLFNLTRNLGGAVGLAAINTILNDRTDLHIQRLHESVRWGRAAAQEALSGLESHFSSIPDGNLAALKTLTNMVHQQALVMGFADVFFVLTGLFLGLVMFAFLMKKPPATAGPSSGH